MSGIREIEQRQSEWKDTGGQRELYFGKTGGDIAFAHMISSGQDGDPYLEVFQAHAEPALVPGGWDTIRYCPHLTGHDVPNYDCIGCARGYKAKRRMMMWLYVYDVLRMSAKPEQQLPMAQYNGRSYYKQEYNQPLLWDTSAWKESCLNDINFLFGQTGDLRTTLLNIQATGEGKDRRYKIYPLHGSQPLSAEAYAAATAECRPIIELMREQLVVVPTVAAPSLSTPIGGGYAPPVTNGSVAAAPTVAPYQAPAGAPVQAPAYQPAAAPAPSALPPEHLPWENPPAATPPVPVAPQPAYAPAPVPLHPQSTVPIPPAAPAEVVDNDPKPLPFGAPDTGDSPVKSLF